MQISMFVLAMGLLASSLTACSRSPVTQAAVGPAGVPSSTDVNPITGARGGSGGSR